MLINLDHHSGIPIYRQIVEQIRRKILTGRLEPGSQLISVRDLSAQLNVNPMTVSKAYALLENEGLLERRRGIGLFISELAESQSDADRTEILQKALRNAVVTAIQMEISPEQTIEMLKEQFQKLQAKNRSTK